MTSDEVVLGLSLVSVLVGSVVGAKGAARTQAALKKLHEHDLFIDALAWIDRKVLRNGPKAPQARAKSKS